MPTIAQKAKHFVVLMLENRSFDHMLGFLKTANPAIDGLTGTESNPDGVGGTVAVTRDAGWADPRVDPGHEVEDVNEQIFGTRTPAPGAPVTMSGFVTNYRGRRDTKDKEDAIPRDIMRCFDPARTDLAIATLATEFAVCDAWFSSMPGPTWPNRLFVHCATSDGAATNNGRLFGMQTIYNNILDANRTTRIYAGDMPQSLLLTKLLTKNVHREMAAFWSDLKKRTLPDYAFIEPDYFGKGANDQHPDHDVGRGENLIADIYEGIRNSRYWQNTVMVVLYDEHGGIFDHVAPPATVCPDGKVSAKPPFGFDRLGIRVPAVIVSAYIPKGTVDHTVYDHTSVPATVKQVFGLPAFLTKRDAGANTFQGLLSLDTPRTDAPARLPRPAPKAPAPGPAAPLSDLQRQLVELARAVEEHAAAGAPLGVRAPAPAALDEESARGYVTDIVRRVVGRPPVPQTPKKPG